MSTAASTRTRANRRGHPRQGIASRSRTPAAAPRRHRVVRRGTWYDRPWSGALRAPDHRPGPRPGRGCHCRGVGRGVVFRVRRPAIEPGETWGVGHGTGHGRSTEEGSDRGIPGPAHEPSNWFFGQQAWWTVGTAALIARAHSSATGSPSGIGGRFRVRAGSSVRGEIRPCDRADRRSGGRARTTRAGRGRPGSPGRRSRDPGRG